MIYSFYAKFRNIIGNIKERIVLRLNYPESRRFFWGGRKDKGYISYYVKRRHYFAMQRKKGIKEIPIFVISFNRLSYLKQMLERFSELGLTNIVIIDNASTYPPLLEYYETIPYEVIRLDKNWGHKVFWKNPAFEEYRKSFYVVTDPDLVPIEECPTDFMERFFSVLEKYPYTRKVGFSLKIDDIPEEAVFNNEVVDWEKRFYKNYLPQDDLYIAQIDTTFALYLPDDLVLTDDFYTGLRTGKPYQCRHLPWYKMADRITDEDVFYSSLKITGWWDVAKNKK